MPVSQRCLLQNIPRIIHMDLSKALSKSGEHQWTFPTCVTSWAWACFCCWLKPGWLLSQYVHIFGTSHFKSQNHSIPTTLGGLWSNLLLKAESMLTSGSPGLCAPRHPSSSATLPLVWLMATLTAVTSPRAFPGSCTYKGDSRGLYESKRPFSWGIFVTYSVILMQGASSLAFKCFTAWVIGKRYIEYRNRKKTDTKMENVITASL